MLTDDEISSRIQKANNGGGLWVGDKAADILIRLISEERPL